MAAGAKTRETSVRASILVCDDDDTQRKAVASYLRRQGYAAAEASDGQDALEQIERVMPDLVITDMHMPRMDGLDLLRRLRVSAPELPVIVLSANASIEMTLEATDLGARDYLTKPFDLRELGIVVGGALDACRLENEVRFLRKEKARSYGKLIGSSPIMERLYGTLARLEDIATPTVLITGENLPLRKSRTPPAGPASRRPAACSSASRPCRPRAGCAASRARAGLASRGR